MAEGFKMPERQSHDGPMSVTRISDDRLLIAVETDGERRWISCSDYNAARVFASLALFLGIRLPPRIGKELKF